MTGIASRVGEFLTTYTKSIILVVLVLTVAIGAGVGGVEQQSNTDQFESDSPEANAQAFIDENMTIDEGENTTLLQVLQRGDNVLTKAAVNESLTLQQQVFQQEAITQTLTEERPVFGYANVIGSAAVRQQSADPENATGQPTLAEQRQAVLALGDEAFETLVADVFGEDASQEVLGLLPATYTPGDTTAEGGLTAFRQQVDQEVQNPNEIEPAITDAQLAIRGLANDLDSDYAVFGQGILSEEINNSLADSGGIVGPLALLFVVVALTVAYRDLLDIVLGVVGIMAVLIWTFGFMGWAGVAFNQLLLAVPVLLIGLSIDYAIHVFMRYREQRAEGDDIDGRRGMALALAGVGAALVWVTATAALGFLANLTSPIGPLQDFGIVSAFGVVAALVIFGALIPALKIEIDGFLEARGFDREKRAFGTGDSLFSRVLAGGASAAQRFPVAVIVVALLLSLGGAYGATQVDTSFDQTDFLADSPPGWTSNLPGPMQPGTYEVSDDIESIGNNFQQEDNEAEILIRGDVTNEQTLRWLDDAASTAAGNGDRPALETLFVGAAGPDIRSPVSVMQQTAERGVELRETTDPGQRTEQESATVTFAETYVAAAGSVDGVPEENIERLYDQLLVANPAAAQYVYQNDAGEYDALRLQFGVDGNAGITDVAADNRGFSDLLSETSGGVLTTTAAGDQVIFDNVQNDLLDTVIQGLLITLVSVFLFLALAYRLTGNPASLGVVTLVPVALAVTWILGSMWLLNIPFNTLTGTITSLTVGLGIAYSIHISSRYELELRRQGDVWKAMYTTVEGTGGALLGSAATTVGGFGTLAFAILPILRQFGIITGLTIIYAFLASVFVLPSLLVIWTRYFGPTGYFPGDAEEPPEDSATGDEQPAADGGRERL